MDKLALLEVRDLLREDDYAALQYVPFATHTRDFASLHLEALLEHERLLLSNSARGEPILYSYSLSPEHYALRLSRRQRLLGDLFLHSRPVSRMTITRELPEYYEQVLRLSTGDAELRCPFRIVPVYNAFFLADPIDSKDDAHVFLHNDSVQMARYLRQTSFQGNVVADVGTGSGILAFTAWQRGASRVMSVDVNPRALQYAELTFLLNDCSCISLCDGSIEQVVEEAEVILTNPPYMCERTALSLNGGGKNGLDTALRFARVSRDYRRHMIMILELEHPNQGDIFLDELKEEPTAKQVLSRREGLELTVYEFNWNR